MLGIRLSSLDMGRMLTSLAVTNFREEQGVGAAATKNALPPEHSEGTVP